MLLKQIKLFDPDVDKHEERAILNVLHSHLWASGAGIGHVKKFEMEFQKYVDSDSCIAVNSGTSALNLALSLGDMNGKEIILPSLTFVATANAIIVNGAKPVFVDVNPNTLCIDSDKIKKAITKKTRAILPVHFSGMPCNLDEIEAICREHDLVLVEDAAHAAGSTFRGKKIGSHGKFVCFSFHPVKNLSMPTGGLIAVNHSQHKHIQKILNARRWCGITDRKGIHYDVKEIGWNYYMNEFSAAIGLSQLKKLDKTNNKRKKIAKKYDSMLSVEKRIPFSNECAYHIYWIFVKNRNRFRKQLYENGIETGLHYKPVHMMSMYNKEYHDLPTTEEAGKHIVSIPIHPNMTEIDVERVIKVVNQFA